MASRSLALAGSTFSEVCSSGHNRAFGDPPSQIFLLPLRLGRLTNVALVSKRFAALSLCSEEWQIKIDIVGARAVERARQLLLWLPRHALHIKSLWFGMAVDLVEAAELAEIDSLVSCCLSAFGVLGGGQLEQLTVEPGTVLTTTAWLPTLRRLQLLSIGSPEGELLLTGPLHLLAEAKRFDLAGQPVKFDAGVQLPPSLSWLRLRDPVSDTMPAQVRVPGRVCACCANMAGGPVCCALAHAAALQWPGWYAQLAAPPAACNTLGHGWPYPRSFETSQSALSRLPQVASLSNLRDLQLQCPSYSGDSMAGLCSLTALTCLYLSHCTPMPVGLAGMTQLAALELSSAGGGDHPVPGAAAVLSCLTGLSDLWLSGDYAAALPALTALSRLEKLGVLLRKHEPQAADEPADPAIEAAFAGADPAIEAALAGADPDAEAAFGAADPAAEAAPAAAVQAPPQAVGAALQAFAGQPCLPIGPYLSGLVELDVYWPLLANSLPALQQATQLESISIHSMPHPDVAPKEQWEAAFSWLARHPLLQELNLGVPSDGNFNSAVFDALMLLKDRRPSLKVARKDWSSGN